MPFHPKRLITALLPWYCFLLVTITTTTTAFLVNTPRAHRTYLVLTATLTEATTWNVRLVFRGLNSSSQGKRLDPLVKSFECQFLEEQGYEPPQGTLQVVVANNTTSSSSFTIQKSRWILSEDPNDRKDGLWVWGLFKEPLYPFLLLTLQTDAFQNTDDETPPMQLYAQIKHHRRREDGKVILEGNDLCWRQMKTVQADPLGAATVDLYENVVVGTIALQPKQTSSGSSV